VLDDKRMQRNVSAFRFNGASNHFSTVIATSVIAIVMATSAGCKGSKADPAVTKDKGSTARAGGWAAATSCDELCARTVTECKVHKDWTLDMCKQDCNALWDNGRTCERAATDCKSLAYCSSPERLDKVLQEEVDDRAKREASLPAPSGAKSFAEARQRVLAAAKSRDLAALTLLMARDFEASFGAEHSRADALDDFKTQREMLDNMVGDLGKCNETTHVCGVLGVHSTSFEKRPEGWLMTASVGGD
jgi:hypothetical protein